MLLMEVSLLPRPRKCRKVCSLPQNTCFHPANYGEENKIIIMTVDEYETIRLIDKENFSQEECGAYMNIARATVQQIYTSARKKLAEALVEGLILKIEGGDYQLCDGKEAYCNCGGCCKHKNQKLHLNEGGRKMKFAIPLDENKKDVCITFARAPFMMFFDEEAGITEVVENPAAQAEGGAGIKAAQFIVDNGANVLITVRCGENAAEVFKAADVKIYKSDGKTAEENITAYKENKLAELTHFHAGFHGIA